MYILMFMQRRHPGPPRTNQLIPYTTLCRPGVARTDAARQTDSRRGLRCRDVYPVDIDEVGGILRLAPERDGVAARAARVASRWLHQPLRHRHVAQAIGCLGELEQDAVGDRRGLVDDPQDRKSTRLNSSH